MFLNFQHNRLLSVKVSTVDPYKEFIIITRDNPGDALVLKQKYNLEKMAIFEYLTTGAKIMGNNSKFYFCLLETSG